MSKFLELLDKSGYLVHISPSREGIMDIFIDSKASGKTLESFSDIYTLEFCRECGKHNTTGTCKACTETEEDINSFINQLNFKNKSTHFTIRHIKNAQELRNKSAFLDTWWTAQVLHQYFVIEDKEGLLFVLKENLNPQPESSLLAENIALQKELDELKEKYNKLEEAHRWCNYNGDGEYK